MRWGRRLRVKRALAVVRERERKGEKAGGCKESGVERVYAEVGWWRWHGDRDL